MQVAKPSRPEIVFPRGKVAGSSRQSRRRHESADYYDAIHEHFTRDDRPLVELKNWVTEFWQRWKCTFVDVKESFERLRSDPKSWLRENERLSIGVVACVAMLAVLVGGRYYLFGERGPQQPIVGQETASKSVMPVADEESAHESTRRRESEPSKNSQNEEVVLLGEDLPNDELTVAGTLSDDLTAPTNSEDGAIEALPGSASGMSRSSENLMAGKTESLPRATRQSDVLSDDGLLREAAALLEQGRAKDAIHALEEGLRNRPNCNTSRVRLAYIAALLKAEQFDRAGPFLTHHSVLNNRTYSWDLLFTYWLLRAAPESRDTIAKTLRELSAKDASNGKYELQRLLLWMDARSGKPVAIERFSMAFDDQQSSFSDALFLSLAMQSAGNADAARTQFDRAKNRFESDSSTRGADFAALATQVGAECLRVELAAYGNSLATSNGQ